MKIFVKKKFRRKIDKLPVFAELWIFGRNRQMRLEKLPPKFWFSALYDFWRRGKRDSFNFFPDFRPKMTSTLFAFWLKVLCTRGAKYWKTPLDLAQLFGYNPNFSKTGKFFEILQMILECLAPSIEKLFILTIR